MSMVKVKAADGGTFDAFLALPPGGRGPGLVLLQEIFGVNDVMRERAAWFAGCGFAVLVPDLFWRIQAGIQLTDRTDKDMARAFELMKALDADLAVSDAAATLALLRTQPGCTGVAGAAGWCLGGKLAFLLAARGSAAKGKAASGGAQGKAATPAATTPAPAARGAGSSADRGRPDATVGYYGVGLHELLDEAPGIVTPLLLHIAGKDEYGPPPAQQAVHAALDKHPQVTLHDYPELGHAFARPGGKHYDKAGAELADLRTVVFLQRRLVAATAATAGNARKS